MAPRNDQTTRQSKLRPNIKCRYCEALIYSGKAGFLKHLKSKHPIPKPKKNDSTDSEYRHYICYIKGCNFTTRIWAEMRGHTNIHNGLTLRCMLCDVTHSNPAFMANHELRSHGYKHPEESPRTRIPIQKTLGHVAAGILSGAPSNISSGIGNGNSKASSDDNTFSSVRRPLATIHNNGSTSGGYVEDLTARTASPSRDVASGVHILLLAARTIEAQATATNHATVDGRSDDSASEDTAETNSSVPRTPPNGVTAPVNIVPSAPQLIHGSVDTPTLVGHIYESLYTPGDELDAAAGLCDLGYRPSEPYSAAPRPQLPVSHQRGLASNIGPQTIYWPKIANDSGIFCFACDNEDNIANGYGPAEADEAVDLINRATSAHTPVDDSVSNTSSLAGRAYTPRPSDDVYSPPAPLDCTTYCDDCCPECCPYANSENLDKDCSECTALQAMLQIGCEACISSKQGSPNANA